MTSRSRRRSRASGNGSAERTRAAFLAAARQVFCRHSYDQAGLREIAAVAGADKRLITRYFGSKERLFALALLSATAKFEPEREEYRRFGERYAELIYGASALTDAERFEFISLCIRSASSPVGRRLVRANIKEQVEQMAENLAGEDAPIRASLLLSICLGGALMREVLKIEQFVGLSVEQAKRYIAPLMQNLIEGGRLRRPARQPSARQRGARASPAPARSR